MCIFGLGFLCQPWRDQHAFRSGRHHGLDTLYCTSCIVETTRRRTAKEAGSGPAGAHGRGPPAVRARRHREWEEDVPRDYQVGFRGPKLMLGYLSPPK